VPAAAATPPGATSCSGCHAAHPDAAIPVIFGRPAAVLSDKLLGFRRDEGSPTLMNRIAKGFSEDELRALAAWAEAQR
jgi:cytochrome c553